MLNYKGQALVVVIVLFFVGTLIAFSLYTRSAREGQQIVREKASAEANEIVETTIGMLRSSDFDIIIDSLVSLGIEDCKKENIEKCNDHNVSMEKFGEMIANMMGKKGDPAENIKEDFKNLSDFCTGEISIRNNLPEDYVEIPKDNVYALFFGKDTEWSGVDSCKITFYMQPHGVPEAVGFIMSTFYKDATNFKDYKPYDFSDIIGFKYSGNDGNWEEYPSAGLEFPKDYLGEKPIITKSHKLSEVRFTSIGGTSRLNWITEGNCGSNEYLQIEIGATCQGKYIGKKFFLPRDTYAPALFDYLIFNNQGSFQPEEIPILP